MGAVIGDETEAIEELKGLSSEARGYLSHHIRNSLQCIVSAMERGNNDAIRNEIVHIIEDLEKIGC